MTDRRSAEAQQYRKLYRTSRWTRTRKAQLSRQPLCEWCLKKGRAVAATVCHHDRPEMKRSVDTFYEGPFTSLCAPCHDGRAQQIEVRGYSTEIGVDGFPVDPNHPANGEGVGKSSLRSVKSTGDQPKNTFLQIKVLNRSI